ncbi:hypothetical protein DOY81_000412, partial [Sarcophaga bullata]
MVPLAPPTTISISLLLPSTTSLSFGATTATTTAININCRKVRRKCIRNYSVALYIIEILLYWWEYEIFTEILKRVSYSGSSKANVHTHQHYIDDDDDVADVFDGNYARAKCIQLGMILETTLKDADELMPALKEKYGDFPFLWVYENAPLIHFDTERNMCLKLGSFA